jgi:hypothetical protein
MSYFEHTDYRPILIDGSDVFAGEKPGTMEKVVTVRQSMAPTSAGPPKVFAPFQTVNGTPSQARAHEWFMPYQTVESNLREVCERIAANGNVRELCIWEPEWLVFNGAPGQQMFYIPRRRFVAHRRYPLHELAVTAGYQTFVALVDNVRVTHEFSTTLVDPSTSQTEGAIVSDVATAKGNIPIKLDDPPGEAFTLEVGYFPVYRVVISEYTPSYGAGISMSQGLRFVEVA